MHKHAHIGRRIACLTKKFQLADQVEVGRAIRLPALFSTTSMTR